MAQGGDDHRLVVARGRRGHHAVDQSHRGLVEQPGGLAALVPLDGAARRRSRRRGDAGAGERRAVRRVDMSARAREDDGAMRRRAIQIVARRRTALVEQRFVVAAAQQPAVRGEPVGESPDRLHHRGDARQPPQIEHGGQEMADLPDVGVRVVESGNQRTPRQIDSRCRGGSGAQHFDRIADGGDASVADENGRRPRRRRLRQHAAVMQNNVADPVRCHAGAPAPCGHAIARPTTSRPSRSMSSGIVRGGSNRIQLL